MNKEELERLYMDIYDNGISGNDYKEKFKRYVNNRLESLEKENKDLRDNYEQYKAVAEPEIAILKTTIAKLRNCMNCKHRDTKGHSSCKDKGIVLCSHWEMKE